ncbi:MAG: hypothetical protein OXJ90_24110 [Spirochaetaceae bacterium]|nr:hypothetical protein [Spirochaetaceae bacterium]
MGVAQGHQALADVQAGVIPRRPRPTAEAVAPLSPLPGYGRRWAMAETMTLRDEDVGRIGEYVKPWLRELVVEMVPQPELGGIGTRLLERMVRVEEELKSQRTLMDERFGFMERRFIAMDNRFEAVDKRFEDLIGQMNARFETADRRFEESNAHTDSRFRTLTWMIGVGFAVVTSLTTLFSLLS